MVSIKELYYDAWPTKSQDLILNICSRETLLEWIRFTQSNTKWMKSATRASSFRVQGNEKFRKRDDAGSLVFYTQSVVNAPRASEELSLALANRSAALFHLGAYQVSIFGISVSCVSSIWSASGFIEGSSTLIEFLSCFHILCRKFGHFEEYW